MSRRRTRVAFEPTPEQTCSAAQTRSEAAVLEEAGIAIPDEQEDEVEKFREFLDQISPEDFESGSQ